MGLYLSNISLYTSFYELVYKVDQGLPCRSPLFFLLLLWIEGHQTFTSEISNLPYLLRG